MAIGLTILICGMLIWAVAQYEPPRPAVVYRYPVANAGAAMYCPGDVMSYRQEARIVNTPAALRVVRTVWSVADERTVVWDEEPDWANYAEPATIRQTLAYTVPRLGPGQYELRVSSNGEGWRTAMYVVPFAVRVGCE